LVVSATDGVFDNLFNHEILEIISSERAQTMSPAELAKKIVTSAHDKVTTTEKVSTPY
jgi:serine/threonine protein phosphatase PrpC